MEFSTKILRVWLIVICSMIYVFGGSLIGLGLLGCGSTTTAGGSGSLSAPTVTTSSGGTLSFSETTNEIGVERIIYLTFDEEIAVTTLDVSAPMATIDASSWLTFICDEESVSPTITSDNNTVFDIDATSVWGLDEDCVMTIDDVTSTSGHELASVLSMNLSTKSSMDDNYNIDGTVADSWTVTNSDAFDVFDVTTNIGELTISDAPESTGDDGLTLSRTVSGDIEMIAQLNLLTFGDISGDSGTCLSGEDPDEETEICTGDPLDVNETPNVAFGTAHHYETGNFLDSLRIIVTDGIDMAVFLIGKQYDDGDNTIYCLATDTDEQEEFDDTNCNVTVSEEAPFYIKLEKEDATGTVTYSIKSGSDGSYIEVGSITQSGFASTDVTVMFGFYDEDELDCYSDLCRAAWGADTNPGYIPSLEVRFESIVFSSGTTTGLY